MTVIIALAFALAAYVLIASAMQNKTVKEYVNDTLG
jgi:hypothetical protein